MEPQSTRKRRSSTSCTVSRPVLLVSLEMKDNSVISPSAGGPALRRPTLFAIESARYACNQQTQEHDSGPNCAVQHDLIVSAVLLTL